MNKYIKPLVGLTMAAAFFASCSPDFLNQEPTGNLTTDQYKDIVKVNPEAVKGSISGLYSLTFAAGSGGTDGHDDFGQKSYDITFDLMSGDMAMTAETYGWFSAESRLLANKSTFRRTYMMWRYNYRLIKNANLILESLGGEETAPEGSAALKAYYGQTKAMRAFCYYNLVNMYGEQFQDNPGSLSVVLKTLSSTQGNLVTVSDVYLFIESELLDAINALDGYSRIYKNEINQDVAKGMLAYVYLQQGNNTDAAALAAEIADATSFPVLKYEEVLTNGFNALASTNWMWGIDLTVDNSPALPTFWGHVDIHTYSYAWAGDLKVIDNNLRKEIPTTDRRSEWFNNQGAPDWKFYHVNRGTSETEVDRNWDSDEVYMRVEEMYLIAAEAYARDNKLPEARKYLKALLEQRDPTVAATVDAMGQNELLQSILYNWRVEMWGEGKGLLTMKRFKQTYIRGDNHLSNMVGQTVAYNDSRLIFEIPEAERLANPNL